MFRTMVYLKKPKVACRDGSRKPNSLEQNSYNQLVCVCAVNNIWAHLAWEEGECTPVIIRFSHKIVYTSYRPYKITRENLLVIRHVCDENLSTIHLSHKHTAFKFTAFSLLK